MRNHPGVVKNWAFLNSVVPVEANMIEESKIRQCRVIAALHRLRLRPCLRQRLPRPGSCLSITPSETGCKTHHLNHIRLPHGNRHRNCDGRTCFSVITGLLRSPDFILTAPQTIYRVENGDYSTLIAAQYSLPYEFDGIKPACIFP